MPLISPRAKYYREVLQSNKDSLSLGCKSSFALDWSFPEFQKNHAPPIIVFLPGLGGHSHSSYAKLIGNMVNDNLQGIFLVLNSRGSAGVPLTAPEVFHKSLVDDLEQTIILVNERFPRSPIIAIGCSAGGGIVTKYVEVFENKTKLIGAISICNCFDYQEVLHKLENSGPIGESYSYLFAMLQQSVLKKYRALFEDVEDFDFEKVLNCKSLLQMDAAMSQSVFGLSTEDYHETLMLSKEISKISIPFLNIQSLDDPCFTEGSIDIILERIHINPNIISVLPHRGGHLSFAEFWSSEASYLERITEAFCLKVLDQENKSLSKFLNNK
jgi:predicted alpha/beta-fold hydrolase